MIELTRIGWADEPLKKRIAELELEIKRKDKALDGIGEWCRCVHKNFSSDNLLWEVIDSISQISQEALEQKTT